MKNIIYKKKSLLPKDANFSLVAPFSLLFKLPLLPTCLCCVHKLQVKGSLASHSLEEHLASSALAFSHLPPRKLWMAAAHISLSWAQQSHKLGSGQQTHCPDQKPTKEFWQGCWAAIGAPDISLGDRSSACIWIWHQRAASASRGASRAPALSQLHSYHDRF